jgi:multidrug efflux pump subunit AcrA (membrane-fusion protein)
LGLADASRELKPASPSEFLLSIRPWVGLAGGLLVGGFVAAVVLMALWPYRVIVRAPGTAGPSGGTSLVHAPREGRVRQISIRTNQPVQQGEVLAVLDPADLEARERKLSQVRAALESHLQTQRQEDRAALQAAELKVGRGRGHPAAGPIGTPALQPAGGERCHLAGAAGGEGRQFQYRALQLCQGPAGSAAAALPGRERLGAPPAAELAEARAEQAELALDLGLTLVRAPVSGVVFSVVLRNPQQVVAAGQELGRIAPHDAEMQVKVRVASEDIARLEPGQRADLRLVGCPYPDFDTLRSGMVTVVPDDLPTAGAAGQRLGRTRRAHQSGWACRL